MKLPLFIFFAALGIIFLCCLPFVAIWAINAVFMTTFAITSFKQWFAMLVLISIASGSTGAKFTKKIGR